MKKFLFISLVLFSCSITNKSSDGLETIKPIIFIDGINSSKKQMESLNKNDIESVSVFKDSIAIAIYGLKAKGGVILIKTKSINN
ncbi:MAG: hypothetical protein O3C01_07675 [Bacteroidetes bacterium]|jgi:TonB-dependent SusC/RagA subfamily outer membrane receptor|nr:hypothetical protein [Bacteroidota bacterium]MDA1019095.1 hypothetical protein [Bacteroidota bacterium]